MSASDDVAALVSRLVDLKATCDRVIADSQGLADHKLLILANYGALALEMAPAFSRAIAHLASASHSEQPRG